MFFADVHCHILHGVDDGARNHSQMCHMVDQAYQGGTRFICATPHFNPELFGYNRKLEEEAFAQLTDYCAQHYPDLRLALGSEIMVYGDVREALLKGELRTLGNTKAVLVEFLPTEEFSIIKKALMKMRNSGFQPVLAHVERYRELRDPRIIEEFKDAGITVTANASSVIGKSGFFVARFLNTLLKYGLLDIIASDGHDSHSRSPAILGKAAAVISKRYYPEYAERLTYKNPLSLFS